MSAQKEEKKENDQNKDSGYCTRISCPPVRTHPLRYYEFTQEEIKALEECDKESFYQRCLPLSTLFATVTYAAIKSGCLNPHPHFGVVPKTLMASCLGYFYGRISYMPDCDAKLRRKLPEDSYLRKTLVKYHEQRNPTIVVKPK